MILSVVLLSPVYIIRVSVNLIMEDEMTDTIEKMSFVETDGGRKDAGFKCTKDFRGA